MPHKLWQHKQTWNPYPEKDKKNRHPLQGHTTPWLGNMSLVRILNESKFCRSVHNSIKLVPSHKACGTLRRWLTLTFSGPMGNKCWPCTAHLLCLSMQRYALSALECFVWETLKKPKLKYNILLTMFVLLSYVSSLISLFYIIYFITMFLLIFSLSPLSLFSSFAWNVSLQI